MSAKSIKSIQQDITPASVLVERWLAFQTDPLKQGNQTIRDVGLIDRVLARLCVEQKVLFSSLTAGSEGIKANLQDSKHVGLLAAALKLSEGEYKDLFDAAQSEYQFAGDCNLKKYRTLQPRVEHLYFALEESVDSKGFAHQIRDSAKRRPLTREESVAR